MGCQHLSMPINSKLWLQMSNWESAVKSQINQTCLTTWNGSITVWNSSIAVLTFPALKVKASKHSGAMEGYKCDWGWIWLAVGRQLLASLAGGKEGGRERCTLSRFRSRGLIEGMLRMVMGNICSGHKAQVGRRAKSHKGNELTSRPKEGNGVSEMQRGKGKETE